MSESHMSPLVFDVVTVPVAGQPAVHSIYSDHHMAWNAFCIGLSGYYSMLRYHAKVPLNISVAVKIPERREKCPLAFDVYVSDCRSVVTSVAHKSSLDEAKREFDMYRCNKDTVGVVEISYYAGASQSSSHKSMPVTVVVKPLSPAPPTPAEQPPSQPEMVKKSQPPSTPQKQQPQQQKRPMVVLDLVTESSEKEDEEEDDKETSTPPRKRDREDECGVVETAAAAEATVESSPPHVEQQQQQQVTRTYTEKIRFIGGINTKESEAARLEEYSSILNGIGVDHTQWISNQKGFNYHCELGKLPPMKTWTSFLEESALGWAQRAATAIGKMCLQYGRVFYVALSKESRRPIVKGPIESGWILLKDAFEIPSDNRCTCCGKDFFPGGPLETDQPVLIHACNRGSKPRAMICGRCTIIYWMISICSQQNKATLQLANVQSTRVMCEHGCLTPWRLSDLFSIRAYKSMQIIGPAKRTSKRTKGGKKARKGSIEDGIAKDDVMVDDDYVEDGQKVARR